MKKKFLCEYPVYVIKHYAINWTICFTYKWVWFTIPEFYTIKQFIYAINRSHLYNSQQLYIIETFTQNQPQLETLTAYHDISEHES